MRRRKKLPVWVNGLLAALLLLLAVPWPVEVQGQRPLPQEEMERFRQARAREMEIFDPFPEASAGGEAESAAAPADVGEWSMLTFASYRDWNYEVYTARGDGSNQVRRTVSGAVDILSQFDRGTARITFCSDRDGNYEIYRMNADGTGLTRLTWTPASDYMPAWSPDGSRIAFFSYRDDNAEVYVMNADGTNQTRLTWDPGWDGQPTWSPDGSQIAFVSTRGDGDGEIWVMNADGTDQHQRTSGVLYPNFPEWSPDGTRFAVNDDYNGDGWFDLAIVNSDGTGLSHPLGASPYLYDRLAPVWSPHGEDVAFSMIGWIYYQGGWYWTRGDILALELASGATYTLIGSGFDWYPDWRSSDAVPPSSQVAALPPWTGTTFTVQWSGSDAGGAGLRSYDVQVRDGSDGIWSDWLPATTLLEQVYAGQEGHTYFFRSRARDNAYNIEPYPPGDGDAWTTVDVSPPNSAASSPEYADAPAFLVTWSGDDGGGSGIVSYDVQVRDGAGGSWTDWVMEAAAPQATFQGELGHLYFFRSRARDAAGNLEAYPGGDGDSFTHTPSYALSGWALGIREQPVAFASVASSPSSLNAGWSGFDGSFDLYYNISGTCSLTVAHSAFGMLPPMQDVRVFPSPSTPVFYLPPLNDSVTDGGFEAGDLAVWQPGGDLNPTLTTTAHTGDYAALLGGLVPPPVVTPTMPFSASAALTEIGGVLSASWATAVVPPGALSGTAVFTLSGVPTVTGLPLGTQDIGWHVEWQAAWTDGTPLTETLQPVTLVLRYDDAAWQAAQVAGEETLALWRYDPLSDTWQMWGGDLDPISNTVGATTTVPGLYALLGVPTAGPWHSLLSQEVVLGTGTASSTLSLLYQVVGTEPPTGTLRVLVEGVSGALTYTLPLTGSGWLHRWWDLPTWLGLTVTLRVEWTQWARQPSVRAVVEEISLGPAAVGVVRVYLPFVLKGSEAFR